MSLNDINQIQCNESYFSLEFESTEFEFMTSFSLNTNAHSLTPQKCKSKVTETFWKDFKSKSRGFFMNVFYAWLYCV